MIRHHCPPTRSAVGTFSKAVQLDGDISAIAFAGIGQFFLKGIQRSSASDGGEATATWHEREAAIGCPVPAAATFVIDVSAQGELDVRDGYERYGVYVGGKGGGLRRTDRSATRGRGGGPSSASASRAVLYHCPHPPTHTHRPPSVAVSLRRGYARDRRWCSLL